MKLSGCIMAFALLAIIGCDGSPFFDKFMEMGKGIMESGPWADGIQKMQQAMQQGGGGAAEKMKEGFEKALSSMGEKANEFKEQMENFKQMAEEQAGKDPSEPFKQAAQEFANKLQEAKQAMEQQG